MSQEHYLPQQYNIENIVYGPCEITDFDENKLMIPIYDSKRGKPLYIQTPELINLFGVIKKRNYSELLLPLGGIQCLAFKNFLNTLQNKILSNAGLNKNTWFKNQKSVKFIPIIKEINKDATTTIEQLTDINNMERCEDGLLKIKITDGTLVKKENEEVSINELTKNKKIRMIIQIYAIWVNQNTFGIYIKPEIIEEKIAFNLTFIEENVILESDDETSESNYASSDDVYDEEKIIEKYVEGDKNKSDKSKDSISIDIISESPTLEKLRKELGKTESSKKSRKSKK